MYPLLQEIADLTTLDPVSMTLLLRGPENPRTPKRADKA